MMRAPVVVGALALIALPLACGSGGSDHGNGSSDAGEDGTLSDGAAPHADSSVLDASDAPAPTEGGAPGEGGGTMGPVTGVLTYHNDNARSGQSTIESILTPAGVNQAQFGKKFALPVDGYLYGQPLYAAGVPVPNEGTHDLVFVATENDTVYAFDADTMQAPVWQVSFLSAGVTTVPPGDTGESEDLIPKLGITSTPVIDPATGTLYVVANTKEPGPTYFYRIHALDIATGAEKLGGPVSVTAQIAGTGADNTNGVVTFDPLHDLQRPALLLAGGVLYVAFGDHGDHFNWHGWIMGYDASTLQQKYVFCTSPDANEVSIWQSGAGIAGDSAGNIYVETGNGDFDGDMGGRDFGMSVIKLGPTAAVVDWFTPHDQASLSAADVDLGSSGPIVLPDQSGAHPHLTIATGKPGLLYLLDRDQMGQYNAADDSQIVQTVSVQPNTSGVTAGIFATPAYWNGNVYIAAVDDTLKAFSLASGTLSATPTSQSAHLFGYPGATPSVSSSGTSNGIVWVVEGDGYVPSNPAVLHAFDATNLATELYDSTQAGSRDQAGPAGKFTVPTVYGGKVFVGTQTELDVYGTLP
jgi:hypothetical protein